MGSYEEIFNLVAEKEMNIKGNLYFTKKRPEFYVILTAEDAMTGLIPLT